MPYSDPEVQRKAQAAWVRAKRAADPTATRASQSNVRIRNAAHVNAQKDNPCTDCGGRFPTCAMDFDHLDGATKVNEISILVRWGATIAVLDAEMAKCELVCANCHRVRTWKRKLATDGQ